MDDLWQIEQDIYGVGSEPDPPPHWQLWKIWKWWAWPFQLELWLHGLRPRRSSSSSPFEAQ
jgi:hypothetical protein